MTNNTLSLLAVAALCYACVAPANATPPTKGPSPQPAQGAPQEPPSPVSEPPLQTAAAPPNKCGPNTNLKCGPPHQPLRPTAPSDQLAAPSLVHLLSTEHNGIILRALVGRLETGHFLQLDKVKRGATEGDADLILWQHYVELSQEMPTAFVTLQSFRGDALHFTLESTPGGSAKTCQVIGVSSAPRLQCVIARGGKIRPPRE